MPAPHRPIPPGLTLEDEIAVIWMTAFGAGPGEIAAYLGVSPPVARGIIRRLAAGETLMRAALEVAHQEARSEPASDRDKKEEARRGGLVPYAGKR